MDAVTDGTVEATPGLVFSFDGVEVVVSRDDVRDLIGRALRDRRTVSWGQIFDLFGDEGPDRAVDWFLDQLVHLAATGATAALDGDLAELRAA